MKKLLRLRVILPVLLVALVVGCARGPEWRNGSKLAATGKLTLVAQGQAQNTATSANGRALKGEGYWMAAPGSPQAEAVVTAAADAFAKQVGFRWAWIAYSPDLKTYLGIGVERNTNKSGIWRFNADTKQCVALPGTYGCINPAMTSICWNSDGSAALFLQNNGGSRYSGGKRYSGYRVTPSNWQLQQVFRVTLPESLMGMYCCDKDTYLVIADPGFASEAWLFNTAQGTAYKITALSPAGYDR